MLQSIISEKKLVKSLKNCFLGGQICTRGHYGPYLQWKTMFLTGITKADHQLSETFYFIKICFDWVMNLFYLESCFLSKKCNFQLKQLWWHTSKASESSLNNLKLFFRMPANLNRIVQSFKGKTSFGTGILFSG